MLKSLLRIRLASLAGWIMGTSRAKKKGSTAKAIGYGLLFLYVFGVFGALFFLTFGSLGDAYHTLGLDWLYFALFAVADLALMFIFSVFTAKSQLFEAKDNELLLSMPIPPRQILTSRLVMLLGINYLFELIVAVPAGISGHFATPWGVFSFVVLCLVLPLFSAALSSFFGWLIAKIAVHVRNKAAVSTLLSVVFIGAYLYVYYAFFAKGLADLLMSGQLIADRLSAVAILYWLGTCMAEGKLLYLLFAVVLLVIPFLLAWWLLSRTFVRTATEKQAAARVRYEEKTLQVSSASKALVQKELRRLGGSSVYMLNAGLGLVFLLLLGGALLVERDKVLSLLPLIGDDAALAVPVMVLAIVLMNSTVTFTAASVSLEGQSLWIGQSLPVDGFRVIWAKVVMQLLLNLPVSLFASASVIFTLRPGSTDALLAVLFPALFAVFYAQLGVIINLRHANFTWMSETQVVKQGASMLLLMLSGFGVVLGLGAIGVFLGMRGFASLGLGIDTALCAAGCLLLYRWLRKNAGKTYAALG